MLASLLITGCVLFGQAAAETDGDLAAQARVLVRQLDAVEKDVRDDAERQLLELGPAVIEALPPVTDRTSAEVKQRLARVRDRLERLQAEGNAQATHVTLAGQQLTLTEVWAAIEKQTGNQINDYREQFNQQADERNIDVAFEKVMFWDAFDQILDEANLAVYPYAGQGEIAVINRGPMDAPRAGRAAYVESFRFEALEVIAQRNLRTGAGDGLQVLIEAAWEPRLTPIVVSQPLDRVVAMTDDGRPLALAAAGQDVEIPINPGAASIDFPLTFALPSRGAKRITSIKGTLNTLMPGRTESFQFDRLETARQVEQQKAGVKVMLEQVGRNGAIWELRIRVSFEQASQALESHRGWIFNNEAYLLGPEGERIPYDGMETTRQTNDEVGVAYLFDLQKGPRDHTFVYRTPVAILDVPLEYEVKDLELP